MLPKFLLVYKLRFKLGFIFEAAQCGKHITSYKMCVQSMSTALLSF